LQNRNPDYLRDRPMAIVNANDITEPADAAQPGCSCWIKMASVSVEGLRQAFLDPVSRLRLASDEEPEERTELVAMAWEGGFLDGTTLRFNDSLNVLIGGRGTGKSTIIESIRFVLEGDPLVEDARKQHKAFVSQVLGSGAKVSLLLRSQTPSPREYLIERTCGSRATVKDSAGELTELRPADIAPEIEVFGQHEISELARSEERLTGLLDRFVGHTTADVGTRDEIRTRLESTREQIVALQKSLARVDADLAALPAIRETLKRYKDLGLDERLRDQKDLVTENSILKSAEALVADAESKCQEIQELLPLDVSRFDEEKISALGGVHLLRQVRPILKKLETDLRAAMTSLNKCVADAQTNLANVRSKWRTREAETKQALTETLRELQKEGIDGAQYTDLLEKAEKLKPRKQQQAQLAKQLKQLLQDRRKVVQGWDDYKASQFRALERAAKKVSGKLAAYVQVTVAAGGDRSSLEAHIRNLGGRIADTIEILREVDSLSVTSLAAACREGKDTLVREFGLPAAQAERLADAGTDFIAAIEELDLPATTTIKLNVSREGAVPVWKKLDELSTGQKATAVLLLLLLDARGPLVIDQPEDDLDNRFITECIVPQVKEQKKRRQFIFSTHNANIPVLGDAELIAGLVPPITVDGVDVHLPDENLGSIDSEKVRELVEETLEGGREAFELRRLKYGF
jgi:putative AbiEii toxin of type IV toxin-antitoxin system